MKKRLFGILLVIAILSVSIFMMACDTTDDTKGVEATFEGTLTIGTGDAAADYTFKLNTAKDNTFSIACEQATTFSDSGTYTFADGKGFTFTFSNKAVIRAGFDSLTRKHSVRAPITLDSTNYNVVLYYFDTTSFNVGTDYVDPNDENIKYQFFGSKKQGPSNNEVTVNLKEDGSASIKVFSGKNSYAYGSYTFDATSHKFVVTLDDGTVLDDYYNADKDGYALVYEAAGAFGSSQVPVFYSPDGDELVEADFPDMKLSSGGGPGGFPG